MPERPTNRARQTTRRGRRPTREALSLDAFLDGAIELLDEHGVAGFTFRALASSLGVGVGSVYWYIDSKDELLARATDAVLGRALAEVDSLVEVDRLAETDGPTKVDGMTTDELRHQRVPARTRAVADALTRIRLIAVVIYRQMEQHPWVAPQLITSDTVRGNSIRLWNAMGEQLMGLKLTPYDQFYSAAALMNYINGVAASMDDQDRVAADGDGRTRVEMLDAEIDGWFAMVPDGLEFVQQMIEPFREHTEGEQFTYGLDLILSGIRQRAEAR